MGFTVDVHKLGAMFARVDEPFSFGVRTVRVLYKEPPPPNSTCRWCHRGTLSPLGSVMQHGVWDDQHWAVLACNGCETISVYSYHLDFEQG